MQITQTRTKIHANHSNMNKMTPEALQQPNYTKYRTTTPIVPQFTQNPPKVLINY